MKRAKNRTISTTKLNLDYIRENVDFFDDRTIRELICQLEKSFEQDRKKLAALKRQSKNLQLQIERYENGKSL